MGIFYEEHTPRFVEWMEERSRGDRTCFMCRKSIKKDNPCFRRYYQVTRETKEHGDVPSIAYEQCCLLCGLQELNRVKNWIDKKLKKYKVYKAIERSDLCEVGVEDTHTPITEIQHPEAVGSCQSSIKESQKEETWTELSRK